MGHTGIPPAMASSSPSHPGTRSPTLTCTGPQNQGTDNPSRVWAWHMAQVVVGSQRWMTGGATVVSVRSVTRLSPFQISSFQIVAGAAHGNPGITPAMRILVIDRYLCKLVFFVGIDILKFMSTITVVIYKLLSSIFFGPDQDEAAIFVSFASWFSLLEKRQVPVFFLV